MKQNDKSRLHEPVLGLDIELRLDVDLEGLLCNESMKVSKDLTQPHATFQRTAHWCIETVAKCVVHRAQNYTIHVFH